VHVVAHPLRAFAQRSRADRGAHALVAGRLAPEKGVEVAIEACRSAGLPLLVAGDGPLRSALERRAAGADVRFLGELDAPALAEARAGAALALVPSRSAETFGLAAAEAMAAGVPVLASRIGALPELVDADGLVAPGDPAALAEAARRRWGSVADGQAGLEAVRRVAAPEVVAPALGAVYEAVE
jgi:glycosyltransferase involved in cell wall biosynthesis